MYTNDRITHKTSHCLNHIAKNGCCKFTSYIQSQILNKKEQK